MVNMLCLLKNMHKSNYFITPTSTLHMHFNKYEQLGESSTLKNYSQSMIELKKRCLPSKDTYKYLRLKIGIKLFVFQWQSMYISIEMYTNFRVWKLSREFVATKRLFQKKRNGRKPENLQYENELKLINTMHVYVWIMFGLNIMCLYVSRDVCMFFDIVNYR